MCVCGEGEMRKKVGGYKVGVAGRGLGWGQHLGGGGGGGGRPAQSNINNAGE